MTLVDLATEPLDIVSPSEIADLRVAVMIPCYNEALTIGKVVEDFRDAIPGSAIYVFDNNSADGSAQIAGARGAHVIPVRRQGKGHVVRSMLSNVAADVYVMVDGDDTYPAQHVASLVDPIIAGEADMVVAARLEDHSAEAFRPLHHFGNRLFCWLVNMIFGAQLKDVLSGYRAFNSRIARNLPVVSSGFEVEAEMTIQCLYQDFTIQEVGVPYRERPEGSTSKLNTFGDGTRILLKIFHLLRAYKPLTFFGGIGIAGFVLAAVLGAWGQFSVAEGHTVWSAAISLVRDAAILIGGVFVSTGIILHTFNYRLKEIQSVLVREQRASPVTRR